MRTLRYSAAWPMLLLPAPILLQAQPVSVSGTRQAIDKLSSTRIFAFGGVGIAGATSEGETQYRVLAALPHKEAIAAFEQVYESGNLPARCYALAGLHHLDPVRFRALLAGAASNHTKVVTMEGCTVMELAFDQIAMFIDRGTYTAFEGPPSR